MSESPEKHREYRLPIRRPVTTAMIFLTMVVFGWKSYQELSINLMPDISYPTLTVRTEYEGAAPEDVEQLLTRPLEETLATVSGMVQISSASSPGLSEVVLEYTWDTDMNAAQQEVRDRLDLFTPPEGVTEKPVILRYDPTLDPVMRVAITGHDWSDPDRPAGDRRQQELTLLREVAEDRIKSDLEGELGIAQVLVKGGREEEIQVLLDSERLKSLGLAPANVVNALAQQNINLSGGSLREGKTEYLVRTLNEFASVEEIRDAIIPSASAQQIRLSDVAEVTLGQKERDTVVHINGREAVELAIFKWGDANTVEVCNNVKDLLGFEREKGVWEPLLRYIEEKRQKASSSGEKTELERQRELSRTIRGELPDFAELTLISDQSSFITAAIDEVKNTAIQGGFLALIVLFFFLRNFRSTLIVGIAIPISIIATFVPMFLFDISLNIMSLGGIALGVGMLVDDSIIVLESISRCMEEGDSQVDAADRGTGEVFAADAASTFTTICVFLPIAFVEGVAGQLFNDLALTVTFSLLASLAVALYLIPMLAAQQPLAFSAQGNVIWVLTAYRDARRQGSGRVAAFTSTPLYAARNALRSLKQTVRRVYTPMGQTWQALRSADKNLLQKAVLLPLLLFQIPLLTVLFVITLALQAFLGGIVAILFVVVVGAGFVIWGVIKILELLLYIPLKIFDLAFNAFRSTYAVVLRGALPLGPAILLVVLALAVHSGFLAKDLGRELIPPLKQGEFGIRLEAPPGTRLEETEARAEVVESIVRAAPEVETVAVEIGQEATDTQEDRGENIAEFTVRLKNPEVNSQHQDAIIERLRREIPIPVTFVLPTIFSFKTAVEVQIRGDELDQLTDLAHRSLAAIRDVPGLRDPELSIKEGYPEVIIELDRELLAAKGLTPQQVGQRLRTEVQGDLATQFNRAGDKIDIRVRTDKRRLQSVDDLRALSVVDSSPPIPLSSVATIVERPGPSEIRRIDQRQVAVISANVEGRDLGAVSDDISRRLATVPKPADYEFVLGGQNRELQTSYQSLQFALLLALFLVYVVMACQFESIHQPALVMFSVPLAFIGVIYVLYALGISVSVVVFIGGIVLAGVVVNDAIILVDYINQLRHRGLKKREAVLQAAQVRLRPIIMTTLTTVLGLIPMALQRGEGAEIRSPMAITVMAGLSSATILTLIIIPVVYEIFGGRDRPKEDSA